MMAEIFTPGHGLITDSLIMHGIARLYDVNEVERLGDRYRIVLNSKPRRDVISLVRVELSTYFNNFYNIDAIGNTSVLGKLINSNTNIAVRHTWMSYLREAIDKTNFDDLLNVYTPDHRDRAKEGRSKSISLYTLFSSLSYMHGKFYQSNYSVREKEYRVCGACFALANLGLIYGTVVFRYDSENKSTATMLTVIPADKMGREDLLLAQRFARGPAVKLKADLTLKAAILYAFGVGEIMFTSNANPLVLVWRIEKDSQLRPAGSELLELNSILKKIAKIKLEYPAFPKLIIDLAASNEGTAVLNELADVILTGSDPFQVLGEIRNLAAKNLIPESALIGLDGLAKALV